MAQGDQIKVIYRTGTGTDVETTVATKAGRVVDVEYSKDSGVQWVVVNEKTRGGTTVMEKRFVASEVVAVITGHDET